MVNNNISLINNNNTLLTVIADSKDEILMREAVRTIAETRKRKRAGLRLLRRPA
jgi:hypothetical protein